MSTTWRDGKVALMTVSCLLVFLAGYWLGRSVAQADAQAAANAFGRMYIQDVSLDCAAIQFLAEGDVETVRQNLNVNLLQQLTMLDSIARSSLFERCGDAAGDLLQDIAHNRSRYELPPPDSKSGKLVASILDGALGRDVEHGSPR